jgi:hypothetical protein
MASLRTTKRASKIGQNIMSLKLHDIAVRELNAVTGHYTHCAPLENAVKAFQMNKEDIVYETRNEERKRWWDAKHRLVQVCNDLDLAT